MSGVEIKPKHTREETRELIASPKGLSESTKDESGGQGTDDAAEEIIQSEDHRQKVGQEGII